MFNHAKLEAKVSAELEALEQHRLGLEHSDTLTTVEVICTVNRDGTIHF